MIRCLSVPTGPLTCQWMTQGARVVKQRPFRTSRRPLTRSLATVHAMGEGWTGALGTGRLDDRIRGHFDEDQADVPVELFTGEVDAQAVGWGHTAIIGDGRLLLTGRPHDFSALLRLRRLPVWLRDYSSKQTLRSTSNVEGVDPTSLVGRLVTWFSDALQPDLEDWEAARAQSLLAVLTEVPLPDGEQAQSVACSAGTTGVISTSGKLYMFGLNGFGQCGTGVTSNNVWRPTPVMGLAAGFANRPRSQIEAEHPMIDVQLGLQHGICLNSEGQVFGFGKGDRGQLGQETVLGEAHSALPIRKAMAVSSSGKPDYQELGRVEQVAAGMLHSAGRTADGRVLIWGKNILPRSVVGDPNAAAADARLPVVLPGLPGQPVQAIACGSHHTAILLEDGSVWATGISSDTKEPMHAPVEMIPPGVIQVPIRQFAAHMDRTTIVADDGRQVLQVHLWKDPELQQYAVFTPAWVDRLLEEHPSARIRSVHRSWIHSIVVTD